MVDLYLQAMMNGELRPRKRVIDTLDPEIDRYLEETLKTEPSNQDPFYNNISHKAKLRVEIEETLKFSELSKQIEMALEFLAAQGKISLIPHFSESTPLDESKDFQDTLKIDNANMDAIAEIGKQAFTQNLIAESMAIFILLTTLSPSSAIYWYKAGIAAEKQDQYPLAIKFYSTASNLDPELLGPNFFLIDCYLETKKYNEAEVAYQRAKIQIETQNTESSWIDFLSKLEAKIHASPNRGNP